MTLKPGDTPTQLSGRDFDLQTRARPPMRASRPHPDAIADCVLSAFSALPQKYKPRRLADGRREWVPLAGIVLSRRRATPKVGSVKANLQLTPRRQDGPQGCLAQAPDYGHELECVSLATGMKCLPHAKVQTARGCVLHDSHAEVLAMRGFNRWLVDECADLARHGYGNAGEPGWVRWKARGRKEPGTSNCAEHDGQHGGNEEIRGPPFELQEDVQLHMYCSEAPCGDASMELVMREQEDDTPWERFSGAAAEDIQAEEAMLGRGYFSQLGIVRRKPARPDAPVTLSKSCSDKLAMKQCTGLLSSLVSRLVGAKGTWLDTMVLPERAIVSSAIQRAFGPWGRMQGVAADEVDSRWQKAGYRYRPFEIQGTNIDFEYAKRKPNSDNPGPSVPSNLATVCTPRNSEVLINGVLQGRKQDDPKGASCVSRRKMWEAVQDVERMLGLVTGGDQTYTEFKIGRLGAKERESVKFDTKALALKGWKQNTGDGEWTLDGAV